MSRTNFSFTQKLADTVSNLKDIKNRAAIILGTGVGGGIIINGQLLAGSHFQAG
ncbi:ROK family protein [Ligilactobacillus agilis]|uniref:ROK family protein n=1 Tax=Ligilactobacillus agilis TaxID=1601 RepID=UPI001CDA95D0|nr:ROK family protein [Ligilactobacillus agilis]